MSLSRTRLLATFAALLLLSSPLPAAAAGSGSNNTWVALAPLPEVSRDPIFALAADPAGTGLLAGTRNGAIYRSHDGGASWSVVHRGSGAVQSVAFNPFKPGLVLAGTQSDGIWASGDGGQRWSRQELPAGVSVRSFGFARAVSAAGTDQGVFLNRDGRWVAAGLEPLRISALAMAANDPWHLLVGADSTRADEPLPLYHGQDSSPSAPQWQPLRAPNAAGNMISALAAGPLRGATRPVLMGTNLGAYLSGDSGATWVALSSLPAADVNLVAFSAIHWDRLYVASDGGGSQGGGLWASADFGAGFRSLAVPVASVTALAVSAEEIPTIYVATFRSEDHALMLWSYRDTGGAPQAPPGGVSPVRAPGGSPAAPVAGSQLRDPVRTLLTGPEGPYLAIAAGACLILLLALFGYVRRGRG